MTFSFQASTRKMEKLSAERTTLTCLPLNAAAVLVQSLRTTSLPSTHSGTPNVSSAGWVVCFTSCLQSERGSPRSLFVLFVQECFTPFINGSFFDHDGQPYCESHYHERRGSLCSGCQKPITGRCITAMGKKFHPEHFVCAFCLKQLNKGTFKEQNDKPYCHSCFVKLFS